MCEEMPTATEEVRELAKQVRTYEILEILDSKTTPENKEIIDELKQSIKTLLK